MCGKKKGNRHHTTLGLLNADAKALRWLFHISAADVELSIPRPRSQSKNFENNRPAPSPFCKYTRGVPFHQGTQGHFGMSAAAAVDEAPRRPERPHERLESRVVQYEERQFIFAALGGGAKRRRVGELARSKALASVLHAASSCAAAAAIVTRRDAGRADVRRSCTPSVDNHPAPGSPEAPVRRLPQPSSDKLHAAANRIKDAAASTYVAVAAIT